MKKLFRMEEWQSPGGMWHCAHTGSFPQDVDLWIIPARLLGLPLDEYIMYIKENYKIRVYDNGQKPKWKSSNKKVAIVKNGRIYAKKKGTATITTSSVSLSMEETGMHRLSQSVCPFIFFGREERTCTPIRRYMASGADNLLAES